MSDSPNTFFSKLDAMFDNVEEQLDEVCKVWILKMAWAIIDTTPGPNLQLPDTEYYATGRLRGSFRYGWNDIGRATRWDDGPYTEHGEDTYAAIEAAVRSRPIAALSWLQSDVAYGDIVHEGKGRMPYPRPWVQNVAQDSHGYLGEARAEVFRA
jgi:hypothetical protein